MSERSNLISKLVNNLDTRAAYIQAKLGVLVPSQIRALRLKSEMPRQSDLAREAKMHQSRISMFETPGAANVTLETLSWLAAAFKVGLIVKFAQFSEMLRWENDFSQDVFDVTKIDKDREFLHPQQVSNIAVANIATGIRQEVSNTFKPDLFNFDFGTTVNLTSAAYGVVANESGPVMGFALPEERKLYASSERYSHPDA